MDLVTTYTFGWTEFCPEGSGDVRHQMHGLSSLVTAINTVDYPFIEL